MGRSIILDTPSDTEQNLAVIDARGQRPYNWDMPINAVIFDMDGLMLDTEPLYRAACQQAAAEFGYTLSERIYSTLIGRNIADAEQLVMDEVGPGFPMDAFRDRCQALEVRHLTEGHCRKNMASINFWTSSTRGAFPKPLRLRLGAKWPYPILARPASLTDSTRSRPATK